MADKKAIAIALYTAGAVLDKTASPGGLGFRLKKHETEPDAPLSPWYVDLRILRGQPKLMLAVGSAMLEAAREVSYDLLADIPHAISPIVALMAVGSDKAMVTPRLDVKDRGTKKAILGIYQPGQRVLLVDDVVTGAHSKLEARVPLLDAGLVVEDVVVVADREEGGREELAQNGMNLHAVYTATELLTILRDAGKIAPEMFQEIQTYRGVAA